MYTRVTALRKALAEHEDVEVLRQLCADGCVPQELRCDMWKEVLGVSRRPDAIGSWNGPLDCDNQQLIHQHCQEQAGMSVCVCVCVSVCVCVCVCIQLVHRKSVPCTQLLAIVGVKEVFSSIMFYSIERLCGDVGVAETLEQVVTFYCKSRNVRYTDESGWIEMVAVLAAAGMSKADLFNCLYSIVSKYIPR